MDRREKIQEVVDIMCIIKQQTEEGLNSLCRVLGELDAIRDCARIQRMQFKVIDGGKDESDCLE